VQVVPASENLSIDKRRKLKMALSALASFDDLRRCMHVLTDGTAEEGE